MMIWFELDSFPAPLFLSGSFEPFFVIIKKCVYAVDRIQAVSFSMTDVFYKVIFGAQNYIPQTYFLNFKYQSNNIFESPIFI